MTIKLFVSDRCPRCPAAKQVCENLSALEVYDVATVDGLAEATYHGVLATPTVLVLDAAGNEVAAWRGVAPLRADLETILPH